MLVANFTVSDTLRDTYVKLAGGREGQEEGGMPYQEGSPGSIICAYLWEFSPCLDQACMRVNASYYGSREVVAGWPSETFILLNVCVYRW